jgi:hypothetical protein
MLESWSVSNNDNVSAQIAFNPVIPNYTDRTNQFNGNNITKDDYIVVASEAGVVDFPEENILEKGRLGPGQMIAVDLNTQEILKNWEIKQRIAKQHPYGEWLKQHRQELNKLVKGESKLYVSTTGTQKETRYELVEFN